MQIFQRMQRTGAVKLGELLSSYVDEVRLKDSFVSLDVCEAWRAAVGQRAASATAYACFKQGVLYCTITSSIIRNQLYFNLEGLKSDINARLGSPLVHRIILR